jgi:predicted Zn-dependent protease
MSLGVYHAEIIDKAGAPVGGLTYGASRNDALAHIKKALSLNPDSAIARVEYANALIMLDGWKQAAAIAPRDAMERLDVERARQALEG